MSLPPVSRPLLEHDPIRFILAGNATFTALSERTGNRFTFKVRQPDPEKPYFVSLLNGPDNESDYVYLGTIHEKMVYKHGRKSPVCETAPSARAAHWIINGLLAGKHLPNCKLFHEGRCCRCGRKLTVPESILTGIGPECAGKILPQ